MTKTAKQWPSSERLRYWADLADRTLAAVAAGGESVALQLRIGPPDGGDDEISITAYRPAQQRLLS